MSGDPYPKEDQLARGSRRYRRRVASPRQWQAIIAEKLGPCRVCCDPGSNGSQWSKIQMHHLVSRAQGGDDVPANIVSLCQTCHAAVTTRDKAALRTLAARLNDAEYAYIVATLGEAGMSRIFGV